MTKGGAGVLDLQWDPLGSDCLVAILSGGHMLLIDAKVGQYLCFIIEYTMRLCHVIAVL
jgi:hypothetical protein